MHCERHCKSDLHQADEAVSDSEALENPEDPDVGEGCAPGCVQEQAEKEQDD